MSTRRKLVENGCRVSLAFSRGVVYVSTTCQRDRVLLYDEVMALLYSCMSWPLSSFLVTRFGLGDWFYGLGVRCLRWADSCSQSHSGKPHSRAVDDC